jgi:hypothetical protein
VSRSGFGARYMPRFSVGRTRVGVDSEGAFALGSALRMPANSLRLCTNAANTCSIGSTRCWQIVSFQRCGIGMVRARKNSTRGSVCVFEGQFVGVT